MMCKSNSIIINKTKQTTKFWIELFKIFIAIVKKNCKFNESETIILLARNVANPIQMLKRLLKGWFLNPIYFFLKNCIIISGS